MIMTTPRAADLFYSSHMIWMMSVSVLTDDDTVWFVHFIKQDLPALPYPYPACSDNMKMLVYKSRYFVLFDHDWVN